MKLKQIVCVGTNLNLTKEKMVIEHGEVFDADDERGAEILNVTYKNKPVAELVEESVENSAEKDKPTTASAPGDKPKEEATTPKTPNKKKMKTEIK